MFDTMTLTKVVGGVCGTFLAYLLLNWAGDAIYHTASETPHAEGVEVAMAYPIETEGGGGGATTEKAAPVDIEPLLASADVAAGEKVFGKCKACHHLDGSNATGPHLNGVIGRVAGSVEGFSYSAPLQAFDAEGREWTPQNFSEFLTDPKSYAPGTKMAVKLPKPEDRANLIAFLETQK